MDPTVLTYLLYLASATPITIWVARSLFRNGKVFLVDVFQGREDLAHAVNALLVVGFYLLNLGFVALFLRLDHPVANGREVLESLSAKLGLVLLVLAVVHLANVWTFNRLRRRSIADRSGLNRPSMPPMPPQGLLGPAAAGPTPFRPVDGPPPPFMPPPFMPPGRPQ